MVCGSTLTSNPEGGVEETGWTLVHEHRLTGGPDDHYLRMHLQDTRSVIKLTKIKTDR